MTSKLEDFDLDEAMEDDVAGEVMSTKTKKDIQQSSPTRSTIKNAFEELTPEEEEWAAVIQRLEKHCLKTWICIPSNKAGQFIIKDLDNCTGYQFMRWAEFMWPTTKNRHTATDYERRDIRQKCFNSIFNLRQSLKMGHGLSKDLPSKK